MGSINILQAAQCRHSDLRPKLNWKACHRTVRSLQNRIVKSVGKREWRNAKHLYYAFNEFVTSMHVIGASIEMGVSNA